jgi:hypothetical protein
MVLSQAISFYLSQKSSRTDSGEETAQEARAPDVDARLAHVRACKGKIRSDKFGHVAVIVAKVKDRVVDCMPRESNSRRHSDTVFSTQGWRALSSRKFKTMSFSPSIVRLNLP